MKKLFSFFFSFCLSYLCFAQSSVIVGDMNHDGKITIEDVSMLVDDLLNSKVHKYRSDCDITYVDEESTDDSNVLPGMFSVSETKKVQFSRGNLYWDGSAFRLEEKQTDYPATYSASHIGHFYWANLADYQSGNASYMPYAESCSYSSQGTDDKFWCGEDNSLTVDGTSGLYALTGGTSGEWYYLINSRTNASSLYKYGVTVGDVSDCLIIAPDDFSGTLQSSYTLDEVNSLGLICLPPAAYRNESNFIDSGKAGYYWSASPHSSSLNYACMLGFDPCYIYSSINWYRNLACALRLVRSFQ